LPLGLVASSRIRGRPEQAAADGIEIVRFYEPDDGALRRLLRVLHASKTPEGGKRKSRSFTSAALANSEVRRVSDVDPTD
jgi:hypothetical protein